ncbi:MAG: Lin0512 family protein [Shimia sp.]
MQTLLIEFGQGSSLRRQDYTQAAERAIRDALWHNSIDLAGVFGRAKEDMRVTVRIGVQQPDQVDTSRLAEAFPYGEIAFVVTHGGLDIPRPGGGLPTVIATVALEVGLKGVG